ncbi:MAG: hypothetical protein JKX81_00055 [Arenicella sp.]|nr:hypothetical protein [Arenicella sp.]
MFNLKNAGNKPIGHSQKREIYQQPTVSPSDGNSSMKHSFDQAKSSLDQVEEVASGIDNTGSEQCSVRCDAALSMLDRDLALDDETFHKLDAYVNEIAVYLQDDESKRQHYLHMALTTADGDKRRFLSDVFKHLPYQQKVEISASFIGSEKWRVRADGVTLIADHDISNSDVANSLMGIFSSEENAYVKGRILSYLKQSSTLLGDPEILHQLDSVIYNGTDSSVRVAALKAKMQLSEQPYQILPDAIHALRTSEPEFQLAGLIAIDQVLKHEHEYIQKGVYIGRDSIRNDIQNIRNLAVYDGDMKRFDHLIREANTIYLRYFEY